MECFSKAWAIGLWRFPIHDEDAELFIVESLCELLELFEGRLVLVRVVEEKNRRRASGLADEPGRNALLRPEDEIGSPIPSLQELRCRIDNLVSPASGGCSAWRVASGSRGRARSE